MSQGLLTSSVYILVSSQNPKLRRRTSTPLSLVPLLSNAKRHHNTASSMPCFILPENHQVGNDDGFSG